jgi:hypothetical protein
VEGRCYRYALRHVRLSDKGRSNESGIDRDGSTVHHRRLDDRSLAAGTNTVPRLFGFPDRVLATTLHLRLELPMRSLAVMFNTSSATIHRAITEIPQLLDQQGTLIAPAPAAPIEPPPAHQTRQHRSRQQIKICGL